MKAKALTYEALAETVGYDVPLGWAEVLERLSRHGLEIRKRSKLAPLMASDKQDWETPDEVLTLVRAVSPTGQIGLDPATSPANPCQAGVFFTEKDDGLSKGWAGHGLVFVNPPYSDIKRWAPYIAHQGVGQNVEIIALLPARPDTRWWQKNVTTADAICFWSGRLKFKGAPASAPFPSAVVYWGPNVKTFRRVFAAYGDIR